MARLERMMEPMKFHLAKLPCPSFENQAWVPGKPLAGRRISVVSTEGLQRRGDRTFEGMTGDYRVIPGDIKGSDLVMTHIYTNFDRTGFEQDWNLAFPLYRLREVAAEGFIGAVVVEFGPESASELTRSFESEVLGALEQAPTLVPPVENGFLLCQYSLKDFTGATIMMAAE